MLKTIVLLCSVSVEPSACTRRTAIDFYPLPAPTVICGIGDAMGAATQLRAKPARATSRPAASGCARRRNKGI